MDEFQLISKLDNLPRLINEAGIEWADAKEMSDLMEDMKKSILAKIKNEKEGGEQSRERQALATDSYINHIKALHLATNKTLKAKVKYEALIRQHESIRTRLSLEKAKANIV